MTKILVIEDEANIRDNILELLEAEAFEAMAAENGIKGIDIAKQKKPDLIICDVMMPQLDGHGVLKALRQDPATAMIPFIFLTALADKTDTRRGMELGADDYLTKPCTPEELLKAISIRLEKQAVINRQQTEKLQVLRNNIAYSLPHELRTPLNGILGFTELLISDLDSLDPAEIREMVEQIQKSGQRLYRLIQNFLLYAELELVAVNPERLKLLRSSYTEASKSLIWEQAINQAKQAQREEDLAFNLQDSPVSISPKNLKKLIEELIDNALKFSARDTPVQIITKVEQESFIIYVTDQGRGMTEEQIADLGAYMQFERKLYEQQGSGLGLVIVKRLVELHSGELTIESEPGKQTTVRVSMPISLKPEI